MELIVQIPLDRQTLAKAEVEAVFRNKTKFLTEGFVTGESDHPSPENRLGLAQGVYEILTTASEKNIVETMLAEKVTKKIIDTWKLIGVGVHVSEIKKIATEVGDKINNKSEMKNPTTEVTLLKLDKIYVCIHRRPKKQDYLGRRPHLRIAPHPTGMLPRMARALINLTGIPDGGLLIDPMCGAGGFLIEAGHMGLSYKGSDFADDMVRRAVLNLEEQGLSIDGVEIKDALTIKKPIDYLLTDLPYGRGSKKTMELDQLYDKFIEMLERNLRIRAVVVFPSTRDILNRIRKSKKIKLAATFREEVNSNLTRVIAVIVRS